MKNPGTPYRLEMRADSLSSNEEVNDTSHPGTYVFNWKVLAKRPLVSKGNVFPLRAGGLQTGFNVVKQEQRSLEE